MGNVCYYYPGVSADTAGPGAEYWGRTGERNNKEALSVLVTRTGAEGAVVVLEKRESRGGFALQLSAQPIVSDFHRCFSEPTAAESHISEQTE